MNKDKRKWKSKTITFGEAIKAWINGEWINRCAIKNPRILIRYRFAHINFRVKIETESLVQVGVVSEL